VRVLAPEWYFEGADDPGEGIYEYYGAGSLPSMIQHWIEKHPLPDALSAVTCTGATEGHDRDLCCAGTGYVFVADMTRWV